MKESQSITEKAGYLTIAQAAQRLGVSRTSVYNFIDDGRLDILEVGTVTMVVEESIKHAKKKSAGGRPRKNPLLWRESFKDGEFIIKVIMVQVREDQSEDQPEDQPKKFFDRLKEMKKDKKHLFPRTTRRYISESNTVAGRIKIQLIWKQNDLPDDEEYERELAAFRKEFADVLDWSTAQYETETVLLHT